MVNRFCDEKTISNSTSICNQLRTNGNGWRNWHIKPEELEQTSKTSNTGPT